MNLNLLNAEGRVLFVSGAAGGIGRALQDLYLAAGGHVAAFDRAPASAGERVLALAGDAASETDVTHAVRAALDRYGRIDAFVHAAGVVGPGALSEIDPANWRSVIDANLTSAFLLSRALESALRDSKGGVVLFGSVNGVHGGSAVSGPAYAAAKAGLANLGRYLAKEWAPVVRVNSVIAGPVNTPMLARLSPETLSAARKAMLTGQLIEPQEAAAAAAFLLSDHARSITGASLNLSGGLVLH